MKHLMTLMALVVAVTAGAQGTTIYEYPWNPDWDNDNFVGSSDLTGFLSAFGSEFGNPPEPCDYDGTPLEELMAGITNGDIVLDSIFIEYELQDVSTYYPVGCPDSVTDTLIFAQSALLTGFEDHGSFWRIYGCADYCHQLYFFTTPSEGLYRFGLDNDAINQLGFVGDGFFGSGSGTSDYNPIPFPEGWYLDEEGIHIESGWDEDDWPYYANYLHILPYWHYAE